MTTNTSSALLALAEGIERETEKQLKVQKSVVLTFGSKGAENIVSALRLAATAEPVACEDCDGKGVNNHHQLWPGTAHCRYCEGTGIASPPASGEPQPVVAGEREAIASAVRALLHDETQAHRYPIWKRADDNGLTEDEYVEFGLDLFARATRTRQQGPDEAAIRAQVRPLDWQETYVDRGDGTSEVNGWEADSGFGYYSVEQYFASDSYGFEVNFDCDVIANCDDPDEAKAEAQKHFADRIIRALAHQPAAPAPASDGEVG